MEDALKWWATLSIKERQLYTELAYTDVYWSELDRGDIAIVYQEYLLIK